MLCGCRDYLFPFSRSRNNSGVKITSTALQTMRCIRLEEGKQRPSYFFLSEFFRHCQKLPDTKNNPERVEFHLTLCGTNWHKNQIVFRIFIRVFIRVCKSPFIRVFIRVLSSDQNKFFCYE